MFVSMTSRSDVGKPVRPANRRTWRRWRGFVLAAAALTLFPVGVAEARGGPSESGVVTRVEMGFGPGWVDVDQGITALVGPPAEQGCIGEGFEDADWMFVEAPTGPVKMLVKATMPVRIYAGIGDEEVCEAVLGGGLEPLYVGYEITIILTDNFVNYQPEYRANAFGVRGQGVVYDADGEPHRFSAVVQRHLPREGAGPCDCPTIRVSKITIAPM